MAALSSHDRGSPRPVGRPWRDRRTSIPRVTDQRLLLAAEQDQDRRHDADDDPGRQVKEFFQIGVPGPGQVLFEPVLHKIQTVLVDEGPDVIDVGVEDGVIGDGFGAVIDEEYECGGQQAQTDKAKHESDHEIAAGPAARFLEGRHYPPARNCSMWGFWWGFLAGLYAGDEPSLERRLPPSLRFHQPAIKRCGVTGRYCNGFQKRRWRRRQR